MADTHAASNGAAAAGTPDVSNGGDDSLEPMKYIVVTGGVVSGLGKGVTISSIGRMLKNCGLRTTSIKIDPYLVGVPAQLADFSIFQNRKTILNFQRRSNLRVERATGGSASAAATTG